MLTAQDVHGSFTIIGYRNLETGLFQVAAHQAHHSLIIINNQDTLV